MLRTSTSAPFRFLVTKNGLRTPLPVSLHEISNPSSQQWSGPIQNGKGMSMPPHDVSQSAPPILPSPAAEAAASHDDIAPTRPPPHWDTLVLLLMLMSGMSWLTLASLLELLMDWELCSLRKLLVWASVQRSWSDIKVERGPVTYRRWLNFRATAEELTVSINMSYLHVVALVSDIHMYIYVVTNLLMLYFWIKLTIKMPNCLTVCLSVSASCTLSELKQTPSAD